MRISTLFICVNSSQFSVIRVTDFVVLPFGRIFDESDQLAIIALICKQNEMSFNSEFEKYAVKHRGISSNTLHGYASQLVTALTPNIIEERPMNVAVMDVYSRLMMDRIIFLGYPINDEVANIVTAQLLFLDSTDRTRDINMYINSPGGSVYCGLGCL